MIRVPLNPQSVNTRGNDLFLQRSRSKKAEEETSVSLVQKKNFEIEDLEESIDDDNAFSTSN